MHVQHEARELNSSKEQEEEEEKEIQNKWYVHCSIENKCVCAWMWNIVYFILRVHTLNAMELWNIQPDDRSWGDACFAIQSKQTVVNTEETHTKKMRWLMFTCIQNISRRRKVLMKNYNHGVLLLRDAVKMVVPF